jgi:hypothetical protein
LSREIFGHSASLPGGFAGDSFSMSKVLCGVA